MFNYDYDDSLIKGSLVFVPLPNQGSTISAENCDGTVLEVSEKLYCPANRTSAQYKFMSVVLEGIYKLCFVI